jgi:DNA-binding transcriptional LysR family regulator
MDAIDLRHLRYFVAIAEEMSFTRAAVRLRVAQPSLSVQIRALERQLGVDLLLRDGRGIKLSEAGRIFVEQARRTLAEVQKGVDLARQAASGELGQLTIGYNMPAAFRVFPRIVPPYRKLRPNVHLSFRGLYTPRQLDAVRREELDLGFVWLPFPTLEFDVHELFQEPLVAIVPAEHRLAGAKSMSIRDLSGEPLVLASRFADPTSYQQIERLFTDVGAVMNVAYELESSTAMIDFVAMGGGCALLPNNTCSMRSDRVVSKRVKAPTISKSLAMIKKKGRGGLAQGFFEFVAREFGGAGHAARAHAAPL